MPHDMDNLRGGIRSQDVELRRCTGKGAARIPRAGRASTESTEYIRQRMPTSPLQLHRTLYSSRRTLATRIVRDIEIPVREVLLRMERNGVPIDFGEMLAGKAGAGRTARCLEQQAFATAGGPFNLGSPRQLGEILFERMKLPVVRKTATGQPSTDEEALQELAAELRCRRILLEHRAPLELQSRRTRTCCR